MVQSNTPPISDQNLQAEAVLSQQPAGQLSRRKLVGLSLGAGAGLAASNPGIASGIEIALSPNSEPSVSLADRQLGLIIGSLLGDALGGPVEFSEHPSTKGFLCDARKWPAEKKIDNAAAQQLADSLPLLGYEQLRPGVAAYGPWRSSAPAGTVTDDSRHKIVLQRAIRDSIRTGERLAEASIAKQFVAFRSKVDQEDDAQVAALVEEGLHEYRLAANWILGSRDMRVARPTQRLWSGVNNCSGQMLLPTLAVAYAGRPEEAYRRAFELDFVDTPLARDFTAALVAGLASALDEELNEQTAAQRFKACMAAIRNTDPYRLSDVPFAGRQLTRWLDKADEMCRKAAGSPQRLYRLLETEGKPVYWWDAHFTLLVPLCMLQLCNYSPLAAMHLTLDFGHDTDSYAQVLGAIAGACCGTQIFPQSMRSAVVSRMRADFGEDPVAWVSELEAVGV